MSMRNNCTTSKGKGHSYN